MLELDDYISFKNEFNILINEKISNLYTDKKFEELSYAFLKILIFYSDFKFRYLSEDDSQQINNFIDKFLDIFVKDDFIIPEKQLENYLKLNLVISDLLALSKKENSDQHLGLLLNNDFNNFGLLSKNKLVKVLTLYSLRNKVNINYKKLSDSGVELFSFWYWSYFLNSDFITKLNFENIKKHINNVSIINDQSVIPDTIHFSYFRSTYGDQENDKKVKRKINELIKKKYKNILILNKPNKNKIAVVSSLFFPGHSVYRGTYDFICSLAESYELTLINFGDSENKEAVFPFQKVINIKMKNNTFDLSKINKDFILACYPDIGMNLESILLSNLRLAPVQITCHGHSVSTFGSEIDYFISGIESEELDKAKENYSERLILIPETGLHSSIQFYQKKKTNSLKNEFIIACPWTFMKINHEHLLNLLEIKNRAEKPIKFRFFTAIKSNLSLNIFTKELKNILGENHVEVLPFMWDYMDLLTEASISLDSFHFGGYNTIIDSLFLSKPIVTIAGSKAYNRFSGTILKNLDLEELVTCNNEQYIEKAIELINNDSYRKSITNKIMGINLREKIFDSNEPQYFKKAVDFLIDNYEALKRDKSKVPIIIEA